MIAISVSSLHRRQHPVVVYFFFFFNDTATTEIYTLSLHDALPIFLLLEELAHPGRQRAELGLALRRGGVGAVGPQPLVVVEVVGLLLDQVLEAAQPGGRLRGPRSEEHTSELQSQAKLGCRPLLVKK